MACYFNCSSANLSSMDCEYLDMAREANCGPHFDDLLNASNCTIVGDPNYERGLTAVVIFILSLIGNISTIAVLSKFKIHKIPDVLVIGLAITDLIATFIPLPMSIYAYFTGYQFSTGAPDCIVYATVAQFTRYSSALIVTTVSLERYFAVNHPFFYRKNATPGRFVVVLIVCWIAAFALAVAPALDPCTRILPHEGFCLFDVASPYAISVVVYSGLQYIMVFFCFVTVTYTLIKVYRRRKQLRVQGKYNKASKAQDRQITFTKPNLTSRISDLSKSLKKAAPLMAEKFQFGVEAQFAGMLFVVVVLFYLSWTTILTIIILALARGSDDGLEEALFWGIRFAVISTAINPLLYGILARQYRLAYWYVIKLALSKCCRCVSPPLKDIFASARAPGGDVRSEATTAGNRRRRFKKQGRENGTHITPGSTWSRTTAGLPVLTRTTQVSLQGDLEAIQEVDYLYSPTESIIDEHSTYVPSAGELASSVIIPHQKRDKNNSETENVRNTIRATASLDNLVDGISADFGLSQNHHPGVNNPLVTELNGEEMSLSDQGSGTAIDNGFQIGRLYSNPVYQIEVARRSREVNSSTERQAMLAASSADDITLVSKVKLDSKMTRSTIFPTSYNSNNNNTIPRERTMGASVPDLDIDRGHTLPSPGRGVRSNHVVKVEPLAGGEKDCDQVEEVKDEEIVYPEEKQLEQLRRLQQKQHVSRSQDFDVVRTDSKHVNKRSSLNIEPISNSGVHELRMRFESSSTTPTPPTSPPTRVTTITTSQSNGTGGRRNSVGNSDSGRESMVLDTDMHIRVES